jgi:copper chaperone
MSDGHCAKTVIAAVEALPSVERALADMESGKAVIEGNANAAA